MDLRPTDEQVQLVDTFAAFYARESTTERVRAAEPLGFDKAMWERLTAMGVVEMAVPESDDGWGASLLDLCLIAEQQGRAVAPVPVIETQVAARLLSRVGALGALAPAMIGDRMVTLALHPVAGDLAPMVPAAAVADDAVVLAGDRLLLVPLAGARRVVDNVGSMPVADVTTAGAVELASGDAAVAAFDAAIDEWLVLTSSALVGIGARSLEIGVDYVKERRAFGAAIGSFQAIGHRLADVATLIDGARLLTQEAGWASEAEPARFGELAPATFPIAFEAARDASYWTLHFHGGYGFMMEYDIQLYWRRARAWAGVFGAPALAWRRMADRRYGRV